MKAQGLGQQDRRPVPRNGDGDASRKTWGQSRLGTLMACLAWYSPRFSRSNEGTTVNLKGTLPTLILQVLAEGTSHGYRIAQDIKARSKGVLEFKEGTLYPALHTLEGEGYLESFKQIENGRTRRYYKLTEKGRKELAKQREEWRKLAQAVTLILEGA